MNVIGLLLSLGLVTAGAELLVRGASSLALRAGLSPLFIGLTIVGFGTSTPELGASITATLNESSDVSVGNVIGSNVFNIAVILGTTAIVCPIAVRFAAVRRDLLVSLVVVVVPYLALPLGGHVPRALGAMLVLLLCGYLFWAYRSTRQVTQVSEVDTSLPAGDARVSPRALTSLLLVGLGLTLLVLGSSWFVEVALTLSRAVGISELVLGLTVVSAGTSLPELVTSLVAARRGSVDLAIGNVLGSNIFNLLGILGVSAAIHPQSVNTRVLLVDGPVLLIASVALLPIMWTGGRISRGEGALLLGGYVLYVVAQLSGWFEGLA